MREGFLDEEERDDRVHLEHLAKEGRVGALEIARGDDGGVVDDGVEAAETLESEGYEACGTAFFGEVFDVEGGGIGADLRDGFFPEITLEPVDDDPGSLGGALLRDGFPDAGAAAGDEDDFVGEAHQEWSGGVVEWWSGGVVEWWTMTSDF
jgi:hypothetical protein